MKIAFLPTRKEFELIDEAGYRFVVVLTHDREWGWTAGTTCEASGRKTEEWALRALLHSVTRLRQMLVEATGSAPDVGDLDPDALGA